MKMFNKVLAVVLSLLMLLTVVPVSAFAATPAPGTGTGSTGNTELAVTVSVPDPTGTGADGTITLNINAAELIAALKDEKSVANLVQLLRDMITRSNAGVITLNDLLKVVSVDTLMYLVLGENNENLPDLIKEIGGIGELTKLIDVKALIVTADSDKLADFVLALEGLIDCVYIDVAVDLIDLKNAINYVDGDLLQACLNGWTLDDVEALVGSGQKLEDLFHMSALLQDLTDKGLITADDADTSKLMQNSAVKEELVKKIKADYKNILTAAGIEKVKAKVVSTIDTSALGDADLKVDPAVAFAGKTEDEVKALLKTDAETYADQYVRGVSATTTYIKDSVVQGMVDTAIAALDLAFLETLTDDDYDSNKAASTLVDIFNALNSDADPSNDLSVLDFLKSGFNPFEVPGVAGVAMNHVDWNAVNDPEKVDQVKLIQAVLGANGKITDLILPENVSKFVKANLTPIFDQIADGTLKLESIVDVDKLLNTIPASAYADLLAMVNRSALVAQVKANIKGFAALAAKLSPNTILNIALPIATTALTSINLISIDGYEIVAKETEGDYAGLPTIKEGELLKALISLVPTLTEIAETDGKLLSFNFYISYNAADGTVCTKDINLEVVVEGDLTPVKNLAAKLAQFIAVKKNGSMISVELTVPAAVANAYRKFLESERGAELVKKVLKVPGMTGEELVAAYANLTPEQLLNLFSKLSDLDVEQIYNTIMNLSYVEVVLEKLVAAGDRVGINFTLEDLQDLNEVIDRLANSQPTFERICEAISARVNVDVMTVLKRVATTADGVIDRSALIQKYLNAAINNIPYAKKFVNDKSLAEILEAYKDVNPMEAVSNYIANRVGVNALEVLKTYDANEIYQKAWDRALTYEDFISRAFTRSQTLLSHATDPDYEPQTRLGKLVARLIPDDLLAKALATSVSGFYRGNGVFSTSVGPVKIDLAAWSSKVLNKAENAVTSLDYYVAIIERFLPAGVNLNEAAIEKALNKVVTILGNHPEVLDRILPQRTVEIGVELTVKFRNIYNVTYLDENGDQLVSTFLPVGVDPAKYVNAPEVEGKEFLGWEDATGNAVTTVTGDLTLKAVYSSENEYEITFVYDDGKAQTVLGTVTVKEGETLTAEDLAAIKAAAAALNPYLSEQFDLVWYLNGTAVSEADLLAAAVTGECTYTCRYEMADGVFTVDGENTVSVTLTGKDEWLVTVSGSNFALTVDLTKVDLTQADSLTVKAGDITIALDADLLAQLLGAAQSSVSLTSRVNKSCAVSFGNTHYTYNKENTVYSFEIGTDGNKFTANFAGDCVITVPFAGVDGSIDGQRTQVYVLTESGAEAVATTAFDTAEVTFKAPHFSDFVAVNEYQVSKAFTGVSTVTGTLNVDGEYIPAGATIKTIRPQLTNGYGYYIDQITYTDENGAVKTIAKIGDSMEMPACAVTVTSKVAAVGFAKYYAVGTQVFTSQADAETALNAWTAPAGYQVRKDTAGKPVWIGSSATDASVTFTPALDAITYTVTFEGVSGSVVFTAENFAQVFTVPAVPAKAGYNGAWKDLKTTAAEMIAAVGSATTLEIKAEYTPRNYSVILPTGTVSVACGSTYTIAITAPAGYTLGTVTCTNLSNNTAVAVTGNSFVMPAANVQITAEMIPNTLTFKVGGSEIKAAVGTYATFTVNVPKAQVLTGAPTLGTLVSFTVNADGSKAMVYSFLVTATMADNTEITYAISALTPATVSIANGLTTDSDAPASAIKGLTFDKFVSPDAAKFNAVAYQFATYSQPSAARSLLWLWILLVIILLIALIALFYTLYIRGILKPNGFLRFITWLVSIFFSFCLGMASLVLWLLHGIKKTDKVNYEEFGMKNPEEKSEEGSSEEETAEEVVSETAEETAPEENSEETSEEATEEAPAEETSEEVVSETAEEVAPEEATAEEATAEEATAEEAPAEEATAEEAPAEEATAEEAPAEEATSEETSEEATKDEESK